MDKPMSEASRQSTLEPLETTADARPDDCECTAAFHDVGLPCWTCARAGYETPNPETADA